MKFYLELIVTRIWCHTLAKKSRSRSYEVCIHLIPHLKLTNCFRIAITILENATELLKYSAVWDPRVSTFYNRWDHWWVTGAPHTCRNFAFAQTLYRIYEAARDSPATNARQAAYVLDYLSLMISSNFVAEHISSIQSQNGMLHGSF